MWYVGGGASSAVFSADSLKGLVLSLVTKIDDLVEQKALHEQNETLQVRIDEALARIAELEGRAGKALKTPTNSSLPPSRGQKANVADRRPRRKAANGIPG